MVLRDFHFGQKLCKSHSWVVIYLQEAKVFKSPLIAAEERFVAPGECKNAY